MPKGGINSDNSHHKLRPVSRMRRTKTAGNGSTIASAPSKTTQAGKTHEKNCSNFPAISI